MRMAFLLSALALAACASEPPPRAEIPLPVAAIEPQDRVEVVVVGAPDPLLLSQTQRKATAREAAMTKARHQLSSTLRSLVLQSGITLQSATALDPRLDDRVEQEVSSAQYTAEFTPDDGCLVRLLLSKERVAEDLGVRFR